jgi:uncharacterized membrane protein
MLTSPLLTKPERKKIVDVIAEAERHTVGEIRVSIHRRRAWKERGIPLYELALREFHRLGMEKTKHKTGVLLFVCVGDRAFQIIADEGIHKRVGDEYWNGLAATLSSHFKKRNFCDGICHIINEIGEKLRKEFPRTKEGENELPNDVVVS